MYLPLPIGWAKSLPNKPVKYGQDEPANANAWQLFNLKSDPKEKNNVAANHPDIVKNLYELFLVQRSKDLKKSK